MTTFDGLRDSDLEGKMPPLFVRDQPKSWPDELAEREAEFETFDENSALGQARAREIAAGFAAFDRLAIDGGPVVEMPRRHRGTIHALLMLIALAAFVWFTLVAT